MTEETKLAEDILSAVAKGDKKELKGLSKRVLTAPRSETPVGKTKTGKCSKCGQECSLNDLIYQDKDGERIVMVCKKCMLKE